MEPQVSSASVATDRDLDELLLQSIAAEQRGHFRLAAMGYRGVLDLCFNKLFGHDMGTFISKLEEAQNRGHLSPEDVVRLEVALTAGHMSACGRFDPQLERIEWVRQLTHRLVEAAYQVPENSPESPI